VNTGLPYRILEHAGVFRHKNDIVLFGGCLLDIVLGRGDSIRDYDLRLVGDEYMNDEAKCVAKAKEFVASIFSFVAKDNENVDQQIALAKEEGRDWNRIAKCNVQEIVVSRARSTVSIHIPRFGNTWSTTFQLTFAPVQTVKDLLGACQPHCTRLAVADGAVVLDNLGLFSIESMAIALDTSSFVDFYCGEAPNDDEQARRISSGRTIEGQWVRYIKYYTEKGFDIILPELEMSKVPRRNLEYGVVEVLPLPCMTVVYDQVDHNSIMAVELRLPKDLTRKIPESGLRGTYDTCTAAPNVGDAIHHNVRCLVSDVYDSFKYVAKGERWDSVFDFTPSLTPRMVKKTYETVSEDLVCGGIPIARLTGYFSVTRPDEVVERLIAKPLRESVCRKGSMPKSFAIDNDVLKGLLELEVSHLIEKIDFLRETMVNKCQDKLVYEFPQNVSSKEDVYGAIYGTSGIKQLE